MPIVSDSIQTLARTRSQNEKGTGYIIDEGNYAQPPARMIVPATSGIRGSGSGGSDVS